VAILVSAGCKRDRTHEGASRFTGVGATKTTSAEVQKMTESAVDRIASERCQREVACNHVGPSMRHASFESCLALEKSESVKELNPQACPRGIDQMKLVDCLAAIEGASCLDPIGAIVRV
jgi:hypothetical protein